MPSAAPASATIDPKTTDSPPRALTLPAATIATLSPHPFLLHHLHRTPPIRPNGRSPSHFRVPACTTSSLSQCAGSAVIRTGDTAVACGIQAEVMNAKDIANPASLQSVPTAGSIGQNHDRQQMNVDEDDVQNLRYLNLLVPNIDLATGCSPTHLPGTGPPSLEAQILSQRLYRLLLSSGLVRLEDLEIRSPRAATSINDDNTDIRKQAETGNEAKTEVIAYWTVYISISVLSLAGTTSLLDTIWATVIAALIDVRLPKAWWDPDREEILCSDLVDDARRLRLRGRPLMASWGIFEGRQEDAYMREQTKVSKREDLSPTSMKQHNGSLTGVMLLDQGKELDAGRRRAWFLADPDAFEEKLCRETISVVIDCSSGSTRLLRVEKSGGGVVGMNELQELVSAAEERWSAWNTILPASQP